MNSNQIYESNEKIKYVFVSKIWISIYYNYLIGGMSEFSIIGNKYKIIN